MSLIDSIFDQLNRWRHFPAYQLERRADIFFSIYLAEVVAAFTGVPVSPRLIPELPIKRDLIWPDRPSSQSVKVDYCLFAEDRSQAFFIELKTDTSSRREEQDYYLEKIRELGFRRVVEGIKQIVLDTQSHQKYAHLLAELSHHGCLRFPTELMAHLYPKARRGFRACQRDIEVLVGDDDFAIEVIYVQPEAGSGRCIDFETFAGFVERHDDHPSHVFAAHLRQWTVPAGSVRPAGIAAGTASQPSGLGHRLTAEYRARRDALCDGFTAAHEFLGGLEQGEGSLCLRTAINAHLYSQKRFIAYIKLPQPGQSNEGLVLSPHYNLQIVEGARDCSELLFPGRLTEIIDAHDGFNQGWAVRGVDGAVTLSSYTPAVFFQELLTNLRVLELPVRG